MLFLLFPFLCYFWYLFANPHFLKERGKGERISEGEGMNKQSSTAYPSPSLRGSTAMLILQMKNLRSRSR